MNSQFLVLLEFDAIFIYAFIILSILNMRLITTKLRFL